MALDLSPNQLHKVYARTFEARNKWENILLALGVDHATIESVNTSCRENPDNCYRKGLAEWLKTGQGNWQHLLNAFRCPTVNHPDLAKSLEHELGLEVVENGPVATSLSSAADPDELEQQGFENFPNPFEDPPDVTEIGKDIERCHNSNAALPGSTVGKTTLKLFQDGSNPQETREQLLRANTACIINEITDEDGMSLLHLGCRFDYRAWHSVLKELVEHYDCKLSVVDEDGNTPVHVASNFQNEGAVQYFLSLKPCKAIVNALNCEKESALHIAVAKGHKGVVRALLSSGFVDPRKHNYTSPIPLQPSEYEGSTLQMVELFVKCIVDLEDTIRTPFSMYTSYCLLNILQKRFQNYDSFEISEIVAYIRENKLPLPGDCNKIVDLLSEIQSVWHYFTLSADLSKVTKLGVTRAGELSVCTPLQTFPQTVEVNLALNMHCSPKVSIQFNTSKKTVPMAGQLDHDFEFDPQLKPSAGVDRHSCHKKELLQSSCEVSRKPTRRNMAPAFMRKITKIFKNKKSSSEKLLKACRSRRPNLSLVRKYLDQQDIDVNIRENKSKWTPLMWACKRKHTEIGKLLLKHHPKVNIQDKKGWSALIIASRSGDLELVQGLLEQGAEIDMSTNKKRTSLMWAIRKGNIEVVKYLVAGRRIADKQTGWTALFFASKRSSKLSEIIKIYEQSSHKQMSSHVPTLELSQTTAIEQASTFSEPTVELPPDETPPADPSEVEATDLDITEKIDISLVGYAESVSLPPERSETESAVSESAEVIPSHSIDDQGSVRQLDTTEPQQETSAPQTSTTVKPQDTKTSQKAEVKKQPKDLKHQAEIIELLLKGFEMRLAKPKSNIDRQDYNEADVTASRRKGVAPIEEFAHGFEDIHTAHGGTRQQDYTPLDDDLY